jgi:hypothetical protein
MAVISGGTTLIDNGALDAGVPTGSLILLSTQTASASANISFTTGLDSTYDEYIFKFIDIHPATDNVNFEFNLSSDSGSNYNVTKTTTFFRARHNENGTGAVLDYRTGTDLAQSTAFQPLSPNAGNGNDESCSGSLQLFNPSSTVFVKHFISTFNTYHNENAANNTFIAGYGNTTSAVNAVQFKMSSGNIDDGIIKLYGVKKS